MVGAPLTLVLRRLRRARAARAAALLALAVAAYLCLVYAFSFLAGSTSRHGMNLAVLILDLLILGQAGLIAWQARRAFRAPSGRAWAGAVSCTVAAGLLVYAALLHVQYVQLRIGPAEPELRLRVLKLQLFAAQFAALILMALSGWLWTSRMRLWNLFKPRGTDVLLVTLVLAPLVNYLVNNRELFSVASAAGYLAFFLAVPVGALILVQVFERAWGLDGLAAPFVAGLAFLQYAMPAICSALERPVESLFWMQAGLAVLVPVLLGGLYLANRKATSQAAVLAVLLSVAGVVVQTVTGHSGSTPSRGSAARHATESSALSALLASPAKRTPDVYLLVYDGYAAPRMMNHYGIEDGSTLDYLRARGFSVYDRAYSLFGGSRESMGSLFEISRTFPVAGIGGSNRALTFFRRHGYTTNLVLNAYLLRGSTPVAADFVFPPWKRQSTLNVLYRGIGGGEFKSEAVFQDYDHQQWIAAKRAVLCARDGGPRMLYAHSAFPSHSQNSGSCLPDETQRYAARLEVAREEMRADIEAIASTGREAIVIVAGDHGPYLTGDCRYLAGYQLADLTAAHLGDRYGMLLAIRWPEGTAPGPDRIKVLQDVFLAVSAHVLDEERIWGHRLSTETDGHRAIPDAAIVEGTVMVGRDKGRRVFED